MKNIHFQLFCQRIFTNITEKQTIQLGNRSTAVEVTLPTSGCGIRSELQADGSLEMSVRLIIQMDEKLRQRSDLERMVRCNLPNQMMEMNIGEVTDDKKTVR